jgi:voltage-gated potassium channel
MIWTRINAVLLLILVGTVGYMLTEGLPILEALYQTIITISTVGYGETRTGFSAEGKAFTILLIVVGIGLFSWSITSVISVFADGEVQQRLALRRLHKKVELMKDHFIICGYGRLGRSVAAQLKHRGTPFLIIEHSTEGAENAEDDGHLVLQGDATADQTLCEAGIEHAQGLITACSDDATNVFITLSARQLNPDLIILARGDQEGVDDKLIRAGATRVFKPHEIGGIYMAQAALRPMALDFFDLTAGMTGDVEIQIEEVRVPADPNRPKGRTLRELDIGRRFGIIVVGIKHPDEPLQFNPTGDAEIRPEDVLLVLGQVNQLRDLENHLADTGYLTGHFPAVEVKE